MVFPIGITIEGSLVTDTWMLRMPGLQILNCVRECNQDLSANKYKNIYTNNTQTCITNLYEDHGDAWGP